MAVTNAQAAEGIRRIIMEGFVRAAHNGRLDMGTDFDEAQRKRLKRIRLILNVQIALCILQLVLILFLLSKL